MPRAEREAQMLEAAERVFGSRGFQATTMEEIADQVGVTKPLIYDYFGSKEGLLAATIERARHQLLAAVITAWESNPDATPRLRVREVITAFFEFIDDHDRGFALLRTEGALIGEAAASVERIRQQTAKALAEGITMLPGFAELPSRRLVPLVEVIIGGIERLAVYRSESRGMTAQEAAELVVTTTWDGLASLEKA
jgi:AcrR family transcriptional regulator